jgi:excisionase family DNA binding protein
MPMIHCVKCKKATEMMRVNEACAFVGHRRSTIYRWIEGQKLHLHRDAGGRLLICKTSLLTPVNNSFHEERSLRLL